MIDGAKGGHTAQSESLINWKNLTVGQLVSNSKTKSQFRHSLSWQSFHVKYTALKKSWPRTRLGHSYFQHR